MISLSGRIHLSFPPAALEGRGGLQGGHLTFEVFHQLDGGVGRDWTRLKGGGQSMRGGWWVPIISCHYQTAKGFVSTPKVIGVSESRSEKKVQKSPPPLEAGDVHLPPASKVDCSMMLDAYQHILGTCYRNYHGQNDFIYHFTASQTLDGPISWLSHGSNVGLSAHDGPLLGGIFL